MDKKKRLGRGLDEVADLWLSSPSTTSEDSEKVEGKILKTISVVYPESTNVKGLLLTNLVLELAKLGFGSCILDYGSNGSPVRSLIGNLFQNTSLGENQGTSSDSHQVVRLYGMPSIHIFSYIGNNFPGGTQTPIYSDSLFTQITSNNLEESIIFLYHQDSFDIISIMEYIPSNIILISRPRKESLLISYAYIKTILRKNPQTRFWIIMDEVVDRDVAVKAFSFLTDITNHFLSPIIHPIKFLGSMVHDQALGISLATRFPLVLSEENSLAKESITRITNNLVKLLEGPD